MKKMVPGTALLKMLKVVFVLLYKKVAFVFTVCCPILNAFFLFLRHAF